MKTLAVLLGITIIIFLASILRSSHASNRDYQGQVSKLVHVAYDHLSHHALENPSEPWIAAVQLRDQVLQHEFDPNRRRKLWEGVQKIVEMNSNVRSGEREVRGEVMRVWTWIGGRATRVNAKGSSGEGGGAIEPNSVRGNETKWSEYPRAIA